MKPGFIKIVFLFILVISWGCKDQKTPQNTGNISEDIIDPLEEIEKEQERELANAFYYVIAPSGLSLRSSSNPESEKIASMPLGSKVRQTSPMFTIDMEIEHIPGSMMEVEFGDLKGYAFSGFLSRFPPPKKDVSTEDYVSQLKLIDPDVKYTHERNGPEFHEGYVESIRLQKIEWHEAYYLSSLMFNIPKDIGYPSSKGNSEETFTGKKKSKDVWTSELVAYRNAKGFDSLKYFYRAEGYGYQVFILKLDQQFVIRHGAFAD